MQSTKGRQLTNWSVERAVTPDQLFQLKDEWLALQERSRHVSVFSTFEYSSIAWKHFKEPHHELLVLAIREAGRLIAVAPLKITLQPWRGIPTRVVQWIARWEGNCPDLLTDADPADCWQRLGQYFQQEFKDWDLLQLTEITQDLDKPLGLPDGSASEVQIDSMGYFIALEGSFEAYLEQVDTKVKANLRSRSRKIMAQVPPPAVERVVDAAAMGKALDRFVDLERKSWKADANIGIGKDQRHQHFYKELLSTLAAQGKVAVYFLASGETDLAASLLFVSGDVVYERHIAHNPDYSSMSPGVYLRTLILQDYFGKTWKEFDLMGMHPSIGGQRHKADWATGQRISCVYYIYRSFGRLFAVPLKNALMKLAGKANHVPGSRASAMAEMRDASSEG